MNPEQELPAGWTLVPLGALGTWTSGGTPPRDRDGCFGGSIPWVKTGELIDGPIHEIAERITVVGLKHSSARVLPRGTLLVAMYGSTIGKLGILTEEAATNQACAALLPTGPTAVLIPHVFQFLRWKRAELRQLGRGGAQPNISQRILRGITCPLPPLEEQRRMGARIEELQRHTGAASEALKAIPALLQAFRRSVLSAAFRGDLTSQWRACAPEAESTTPHQQPSAPAGSVYVGWGPGKRPNTWAWMSFADLFSEHTHARKKLPRKEYRDAGALPVIDQGAVAAGGFTDRQELAYEGPLPCLVFGDHTRRVKYVSEVFVQGADGVKVLSPRAHLNPRFAYWLLCAVMLPDLGYARHMSALRACHFPVPPRPEQDAMVTNIEKALESTEGLAGTAADLTKQIHALNQAILSRAFKGELVAQDPDDEPAAALVARIRAETAEA